MDNGFAPPGVTGVGREGFAAAIVNYLGSNIIEKIIPGYLHIRSGQNKSKRKIKQHNPANPRNIKEPFHK
jgi:hypothetical protein